MFKCKSKWSGGSIGHISDIVVVVNVVEFAQSLLKLLVSSLILFLQFVYLGLQALLEGLALGSTVVGPLVLIQLCGEQVRLSLKLGPQSLGVVEVSKLLKLVQYFKPSLHLLKCQVLLNCGVLVIDLLVLVLQVLCRLCDDLCVESPIEYLEKPLILKPLPMGKDLW